MPQITIPAQVVNGHLQHEKSLAELEGQHVLVALKVVATDALSGNESEEMLPKPEIVWSESYCRAKKPAEEFSGGTNAEPH